MPDDLRKPPQPVSLPDAISDLSGLLDRAVAGEEIVIARDGKPVARLVPVGPATEEAEASVKRPRPRFNAMGITYLAPDWDAPMSDEELREWGMID